MACEAPIPAYRPATGGPLKFRPPTDGRAYIPIQIPCGICILCLEEKARQWAVRIAHEATMHEHSCFITLTYNKEHEPAHGSLQYDDLQKFWKRLRQNMVREAKRNRTKLPATRYYAVGEYGDIGHRPHYHACIFGHSFTRERRILRTSPTILWTNPDLERAWSDNKGKPIGYVSVGALNYLTASYTASYVTKKLARKQKYVRIDEQTGELIALEQPRAFMSKNIAREWYEKFGHQVTENDYIVINGTRQKPPAAYDRWLKARDEKKIEEIKERRKEQATKLTSEQLRARARNAHARAKSKKKSV